MVKQTIYFILLLNFCGLFSQQKTNEDLKVGLVLSGGGAKGLAHIGALKVIEESGVRIDYIAGTSMGAIVGALYSAGYSADELEILFKTVDFEKLIRDDFLRKNKSFYEREDDDKHAVTLPFNRFSLGFPSALSRGQNVYNFYVKSLKHVSNIDDFSKLPIPFFCVATNLETGKQEVLENGYLPNAITASSAIPSLFEPVSVKGKLMIDGGLSNNYPINELLAKKVDVVIGVDVQDSLHKKGDLKSMVDVMSQISNFTTQNQMQEKVSKTDVYIKPDITNFNIISFDKASEIYTKGYEAALLSKSKLEAIAATQKLINKRVVDKLQDKNFTINNIYIYGNKNYTEAYILGKLKIKQKTKINYDEIEKGIIALAATNNFHKIDYKVTKDKTLVITLKETNNKTLLKLGVHYDNVYKGNVLVNLTHKQLLTNNDIISIDAILGEKFRYSLDYYLDKGFYWSIGVKSNLNAFDKDINLQLFDRYLFTEEIVELEVFDLTNQFYVATPFQKYFAGNLGVEHKRLELKYETNTATIELEKNDLFSVYGTLKYDSLDDIYYPTRGLYFNGDVHSYLFTSKKPNNFEQFSIAQIRMGAAFSLSKQISFNVFTEGGFRVGNNTSSSLDFSLGGFGNNFINNYKSFYGYDFLSLSGDGYVKADIDLHYQFITNHFLTVSANIANIDDGLFKDSDWLSTPSYSGYALGYGVKTFLGPMQVKGSWSPEIKKPQWFISLGYWF